MTVMNQANRDLSNRLDQVKISLLWLDGTEYAVLTVALLQPRGFSAYASPDAIQGLDKASSEYQPTVENVQNVSVN